MQILILAAGQSSRFHPFNNQTHKCQTTLYGKSILQWTLNSLKQTNASQVISIKNSNNQSIDQINTTQYPFKIKWVNQNHPSGQAGAIISAQKYIEDQCIVINNNHINIHDTIKEISKTNQPGVALCTQPTHTPQLYGIVETKNNQAFSLVEKPQHHIKNPMRVIGVYQLTKQFIQFMATLKEEEYLLETALKQYMKNQPVYTYQLKTNPISLKYPWHLFDIQHQLATQISPKVSKQAQIHPTAIIDSTVNIEPGAKIMEHAVIKGHSYIGKNVIVGTGSLTRDSLLEANVQVGYNSEITRSIIMPGTHSHGGGFIGDSIIGQNCRIGAGFITANRRTDRKPIHAYIKNKKINTNKTSLGCFIGQNCQLGIKVATMPNVIISPNSIISPGEIITRNI